MLSSTALVFAALLSNPAQASSPGTEACVADVVGSVNALRSRGTPLRILSTEDYPSGASFPPHHLQGVAHLGSSRTIIFSGNSSHGAFLYVGEMGSLLEHGRWPTNFKCKHGSCATPEADRLKQIMHLGDEFQHPGGIQATGNVLAVGIDSGQGKPSRAVFLDFTDPGAPVELTHLRIEREKERAETVGITRLISGGDQGRYLALASARNASQITFYLSSGTDLADPANSFHEIGFWREGTDGLKTPDYQAMQLITQCDGQVFLLGTSGNFLGGWFDYIHVFQVDFSSGSPVLKPALRKKIRCGTCLFRAGAGALVDPISGELRYYGTAYWPEKPVGGPKVLKFEEFTP